MQNNQKRNKFLFYNSIMLVSLAFSLAFGLDACKPKSEPESEEIALPFETIEKMECCGTGELSPREPGMVIVSRLNEINSLDGMVFGESIIQLQTLDYSQYFALAAFQGLKSSTGYDIQVNRIGRLGNTVNVYAQLVEPPPDMVVGAMETSPYYLVKVQKTGSWNQDITFNLFSSETLVASLSHTIP